MKVRFIILCRVFSILLFFIRMMTVIGSHFLIFLKL